MLSLVDQAEQSLTNGALDDFGRLLDETWQLKRGVNAAVSTDVIDSYYTSAKQAVALGGKLLGAGGGGFLVFYVLPERQNAVRAALSHLKEIPFRFDTGGARNLYYAAEDYSPEVRSAATA